MAYTSLKYSPESNVDQNKQGKNVLNLKHAWAAKWITHPNASTLEYGVFLFRLNFKLEKVPKKLIVFVSADNRYRLFVNGKPVCFGPALGDLDHYRYETINIASYLNVGKNVIAAEVINFGEFRRGAQQTFQTAFILQSNNKNIPDINTGSAKWKVIKNKAYKDIPFLPKDLNAYYCAGPGDKLIGNLYPWGWQHLDFNDKNWLSPRNATVEFAVGRGFLYGSTWFLVPRSIPLLDEIPQQFKRIVRSKGITVNKNFLNGVSPVIIPKNSKATILFDQGFHTVAFPELIVDGGNESKIKITYAEALFIKNYKKNISTDGHKSLIDIKGNRNKTEGKEIFGVYDLFYPDGGKNRLFRPLWKRTFRYVCLEITTKNQPLKLINFTNTFIGYPFKQVASFTCDDPEINTIWNVAWRTLRNSADEIFQDTPYYEQLQYIGDTRLSSLVSIYVTGDDRLMRKAIRQFHDSKLSNGLLQSRYPSYIKQVITPFSLYWIGMLHDYFMYRNDVNFIEGFLPAIRNILDWFANRIAPNGILTNLDWWNFTDWVEAFPNGIPPGADNAYSANISLQFNYALKMATDLFNFFGWETETQKYNSISKIIKKSVYNYCYDKNKKLFAETPEKKLFSQHTNIMAVLSEAVSKNMQLDIVKNILKDNTIIKTTIYFKFYLFRAMQKTGLGNEYLNQLTPWKNMLANGLTTFAETEHNPRSDCHAWSSTPCFDLLHTVAGIQSAERGFQKIIISPNFGHLSFIKIKIPHPYGLIRMDLKIVNKYHIKGFVTLPKNLTGTFIWENKTQSLVGGKQKIEI